MEIVGREGRNKIPQHVFGLMRGGEKLRNSDVDELVESCLNKLFGTFK